MSIFTLVENLMDRRSVPRKYIMGCEYYGTEHDCLMTRYILRTNENGGKYLHLFHRSDQDRELHDHPWDFWTYIIWPGYWEHTPHGVFRRYPGELLWRPAHFRHRVQTINEGKSLSMVWVGPKVQTWGFFNGDEKTDWQQFFKDKGCE